MQNRSKIIGNGVVDESTLDIVQLRKSAATRRRVDFEEKTLQRKSPSNSEERGRTCRDNRSFGLELEGQKFASVSRDRLFGSEAAGSQALWCLQDTSNRGLKRPAGFLTLVAPQENFGKIGLIPLKTDLCPRLLDSRQTFRPNRAHGLCPVTWPLPAKYRLLDNFGNLPNSRPGGLVRLSGRFWSIRPSFYNRLLWGTRQFSSVLQF